MGFEANTIDAQIAVVLATVAAVQAYQNEHDIPVNGFPAVTYQLVDESGEFYDTANNLRNYVYELQLWHEVENVGKSEAARILQDVYSDLLTAFEENTSLNGAVDFCEPLTLGKKQEVQGAHGAMLLFPIELRCKKLVQITT